MEFFPPEWQTNIGTLDNIIHCVLWGTLPLYFLYVSKNYVGLLVIGASMNILALIGFVFFLDESPLYLYNKRENEKADKIVARILRINSILLKQKESLLES